MEYSQIPYDIAPVATVARLMISPGDRAREMRNSSVVNRRLWLTVEGVWDLSPVDTGGFMSMVFRDSREGSIPLGSASSSKSFTGKAPFDASGIKRCAH